MYKRTARSLSEGLRGGKNRKQTDKILFFTCPLVSSFVSFSSSSSSSSCFRFLAASFEFVIGRRSADVSIRRRDEGSLLTFTVDT